MRRPIEVRKKCDDIQTSVPFFFLVYCLLTSFSSRENSDCHNATGSHQEHDIAPVRGTEVLVRISGFAPQLDPQSMNQ